MSQGHRRIKRTCSSSVTTQAGPFPHSSMRLPMCLPWPDGRPCYATACARAHAGIGCAVNLAERLVSQPREVGARLGRRGAAVPEALCWRALREVAAGLDFLHAHDVLHLVRPARGARSPPAVRHRRQHAARLTLCLIHVSVGCLGRLSIGAAADAQVPSPNPVKAVRRRAQDIKLGNIFLDAAGTFQIGDFGLAVLRRQWVRLVLHSLGGAARGLGRGVAGRRVPHAAVRGAPAIAAAWNRVLSDVRCQHTRGRHRLPPSDAERTACRPLSLTARLQYLTLKGSDAGRRARVARTHFRRRTGRRATATRWRRSCWAARSRRPPATSSPWAPPSTSWPQARARPPPLGTPSFHALARAPGLTAAPRTLRAHALAGNTAHLLSDNIRMWRRFAPAHDPCDALAGRCAPGRGAGRWRPGKSPGRLRPAARGAGCRLPRADGGADATALALPGRSPALQWLVQWMLAAAPGARPLARELLAQARTPGALGGSRGTRGAAQRFARIARPLWVLCMGLAVVPIAKQAGCRSVSICMTLASQPTAAAHQLVARVRRLPACIRRRRRALRSSGRPRRGASRSRAPAPSGPRPRQR